MLTIGGWQMHQVWPVLRKQGILSEIRSKSSGCEDDWPKDLGVGPILLVRQPNTGTCSVGKQRVGAGFRDDAGNVRVPLSNLLHHLNQGVGDGHAWKSFLPTMSPR